MARALLFDFNGTLSDDEDVMYGVFAELFAQAGRPMSQQEYLDHVAGLADEAIVRTWLGDRPDVDEIVARRVALYRERVSDGTTVTRAVRDAVREVAGELPLGIVSGAARSEILPVLQAAGLLDAFHVVVTSDDVVRGKPHPEGYLAALRSLREVLPDLDPADVTVIEDTEAGVRSAKAAGMRCVALSRTLPRDRLADADEIADAIDRCLVRRIR
jgi:beta-phosphoglucomutase